MKHFLPKLMLYKKGALLNPLLSNEKKLKS